jgi:hypothetical protein
MFQDNNNNNNNNNNRGNCKYLKISQYISEQHNRKTLHRGITDNSHNGQGANNSKSTNVKVTMFNIGNNPACSTYCNHRRAVTLYIYTPYRHSTFKV